jgi:tripartite-type tricarboxylate transporter receptor subunit TctC
MIRRFTLVASLALAALAGPASAAWPEKPVKVIVPFGPGGTTDVFARIVQRSIQENNLLPQPVAITNIGGHFSVGSIQAKNATPDGYTFLIIHNALLSGEVVDPARKLSYRDFEPVALTGGFCLHHIVRDDAPYKTLQDLVDAAKKNPSQILFGVNIGALNHMGGGFLERASGAKFRFVQVGGGAENYAALKGSQTQTTMLSSSEYENFKGGGVRSLGYTGPKRLASQPDIATVRELGLPYEYCINNMWFAPKGTPKEVVDAMADALEKSMATAAVKDGLVKQASTDEFLRGEPFRKYLDETFAATEPVAKSLLTAK